MLSVALWHLRRLPAKIQTLRIIPAPTAVIKTTRPIFHHGLTKFVYLKLPVQSLIAQLSANRFVLIIASQTRDGYATPRNAFPNAAPTLLAQFQYDGVPVQRLLHPL